MKKLDELVEKICDAPYEYTRYDNTKEQTTLISRYSNGKDAQIAAINKAVYEWANEQLDEIELEKENGILKAKCYAYESIIAKSNFSPMIRKELSDSEEAEMAIEKYLIGKSDLPALLRGEDLAIRPKGNIRGFCVEIAGCITNGDVIKAMFPDAQIDYHEESDLVDSYITVYPKGCDTCQDYSYEYWNAPYKKGAEE